MGKYDSKRVLQIGSNYSTGYNITYVKKHGAFVVVADKCAPEKNAYRKMADEAVQLNIDNLEEVVAYAKANRIDAIMTNFAESEYESCRILNEGIGNTFYHTEEQWQIFMHKGRFRELCIRYEIDIPETFYTGTADRLTNEIRKKIVYPVIVKPTDNCGGIGISVVRNSSQLNKAVKIAQKYSSSDVIIEEFVTGKEVVFTYVIQNGICRLINTADKYVYTSSKGLNAVPDFYIYPCADQNIYLNSVNDKVISMIKDQKLDNCTIFFQAIEKEGRFYLFEAGLRCEGSSSGYITSYVTGQNYFDFIYDYLLKIRTDYNVELEDPDLHGHNIAGFLIHLRKGIIGKIEGLSYLKGNKNLFFTLTLKRKGDIVASELLNSLFLYACMMADDKEELISEIRRLKSNIKVKDIFNRNMIVDSFDEAKALK